MMLDIRITIVMHTCARNIIADLSAQHVLSRNALFRSAETRTFLLSAMLKKQLDESLGVLIRRSCSDEKDKLSWGKCQRN
jgi:hypothetical protein